MRINNIQNFNYHSAAIQNTKDLQTQKVQNNVTPLNKAFSSYPVGYIPHQINFNGGVYQTLPQIMQLKSIRQLPCIYCGHKMVPSKLYGDLKFCNNKVERTLKELVDYFEPTKLSFSDQTAKIFAALEKKAKDAPDMKAVEYLEKLSLKENIPEVFNRKATRDLTTQEYTKRIIEILDPYEDAMMPVEKAIFREIKIANEGSTPKSLQEIMNDLRNITADVLSNKHLKAISRIEDVANQKLSKQSKNCVLHVTQRARSILKAKDSCNPFKRKTFIKELSQVPCSKEEKAVINELKRIADTIPTSENDLGAFVAKYSNKDVKYMKGSKIEAKQRSNEEIAQRLISPSVASVEHIRTQESYKLGHMDVSIDGVKKDSIGNLALAHRSCNSERDNISLSQYISEKPEVKKYIQQHVDFVSEAIKKGELKGMDDYPQQLKTAYENGSHGAIKITLPETKAQEAAKEAAKEAQAAAKDAKPKK